MKYKNLGILFFMLLFSCSISFSQNHQNPEFIRDSLDKYIETALQKWNLPGLAVAIVKDGEVVVSEGFGLRDFQKDAKVDKETLFMIASNTKAFVGTSLAMLDYEGSCDLDDKVIDWIPEFKINDPWVTQQININDILSHRVGMQTFQGDFLYFYSNLSKEEVYQKFPLIEPNNGFREKYGYCNAGYFWAGECIESITGNDWNLYLEKNILEPLEMNNTKILSVDISEETNLASAHTLQNGQLTTFPHTNIDVIGPAASMSSCVDDMSHWLIAQLDSGKYQENQVIPFEAIKNTRSPRTSQGHAGHVFNSSHYSLYGLGWGMRDYEMTEVFSHSGGILGFVTGVTLVPEINLGIVVLTNSDENWFYEALKWEIIDAYLGLPYRDYSSVYHDFYTRSQNQKNTKIQNYQDSVALKIPTSVKLKAFVGEYQSEIYGKVTISKGKRVLTLTFEHHPDLKATLEHINGNRFLCSYYPSRMGTEVFPFELSDEKVIGFSLKVADRLEYTRYDFVKLD